MLTELLPENLLPLRQNWRAIGLCLLSLTNYLLMVLVNVVLARNLTFVAFEDYNVGISAVMILAVLAPLGLDKLAHKCLPTYREHGDWARSRGFVRFAVQVTVGVSILLAIVFDTTLETALVLQDSRPHLAILIGVAFVVIISVSLLLVEMASAYNGQLSAMAIYRVVTPLAILLANGLWMLTPLHYSGISAIACYGAGWTVGLLSLVCLVRWIVPREVWQASPRGESWQWVAAGLPLLAYSLIMTVHTNAGVIILKLLYPAQPMVSRYAVALQIGSFITIVATATNRFYLPTLSVLLDRGDAAALRRAARQRLVLVGALATVFLAIIAFWGRAILSQYGDEYVPAFPALAVIAAGAALSTLYSVAPYYFQFAGHWRIVLSWTATGVAAGIAMTTTLAYFLGELGAAIGYAVPLAMMFGGMRLHAMRLVEPGPNPPE